MPYGKDFSIGKDADAAVALIPSSQRTYLRSHPLALWFALAIVLSSVIALLFPETVVQTPAALLLPDWLELAFRWFFLVGGTAASFGLLRGKANFEALGWALVTAAIAAQVVTLIFLTQDATIITSSLILAALGVGTGLRSWYLAVDAPRQSGSA